MNQQLTDIHEVSHHIWRQALSVDPDGALLTLEQIDWEKLSAMTADLLARSYIRGMAKAKTLWQRILQTNPNCIPVVKASNKPDSPWPIQAMARKYSLWFSVKGPLFLKLYGLVTLFFRNKDASFAQTGVALNLTAFGIYMLSLFGWIFMALILVFNSRQSITCSRMQSSQNSEPQSGFSYISNKNYWR
jgi:hypothetical protein